MDQDDNSKHRDLMGYLPTDTADWFYAHVEGLGEMLYQRVGRGEEFVKARFPCVILVQEVKGKGIRVLVKKLLFSAVGIVGDGLEINASRIVCAAGATPKAIAMALAEWKPKLIDIGTPGELNRLDHLKGGKGAS